MSDIKLFKINGEVQELSGKSVALEKSLQALIEQNLETFLGVRFLASEYSTGRTHKGRIDTLGIDENGCPVIIEYKRATNENVINQGLFYLDWLLDHKAEFQLLVLEKYGKEAKDNIEWSAPRLLCIAGDFTRYDEHAVQQISRNIELLRYKKFGGELLLFDLVNATSAKETIEPATAGTPQQYKTVSDYLEQASPELCDRYEALKAFMLALGDDVQEKTCKYYFAFKRIKNFACVELRTQTDALILYLKADPDLLKKGVVDLEDGFSRDVSTIGHFGTGNLEVTIRNVTDFERAKYLIQQSYELS